MRLPEVENTAFVTGKYLKREWVMDPPPFVLERLPDIVMVDIYKVKLKHLADIAQVEANMLREVAELLAKTHK